MFWQRSRQRDARWQFWRSGLKSSKPYPPCHHCQSSAFSGLATIIIKSSDLSGKLLSFTTMDGIDNDYQNLNLFQGGWELSYREALPPPRNVPLLEEMADFVRRYNAFTLLQMTKMRCQIRKLIESTAPAEPDLTLKSS